MRNLSNSSRQSSPILPKNITAVQSVHVWVDLMKSTDKILLAGLANQFGAEHVEDAYRQWYAESCEHRQHLARLARQLREIGG